MNTPKRSRYGYILTSEINEYNQEGEYFIAYFRQPPTPQTLWAVLKQNGEKDKSLIQHLLYSGGGRRKPFKPTNETWYYLRPAEPKN